MSRPTLAIWSVLAMLATLVVGAQSAAAQTEAVGGAYPPTDPGLADGARSLHPFPDQLDCVEWPTDEWPTGALPDGVRRSDLDQVAAQFRQSSGRALVVVHGGRIVYEWYRDGITPDSINPSFSVSKSIAGTVAGTMVRDGTIADVEAPAPVPEWQGGGDPRAAITWHHLMNMRPGLEWNENYSFGDPNNDIILSIASGDAGGYVANKPLVADPGTSYNYSTGTSNLLGRTMGQQLGLTGDDMDAEVRRRLFDPLGIGTVDMGFDQSGYWMGGFSTNMSTRDFARYGLLHLRDGQWDGRRLLPRNWSRRVGDDGYATQFWAGPQDRFRAVGLFGQSVSIATDLDLVIAANSDAGGVASWRIEELFEQAAPPACDGAVQFHRPLDDPTRRFRGGQQIMIRFSIHGDDGSGAGRSAAIVSRKVHCRTGVALKDDVAVRGRIAQRANGWYRVRWQTRANWKGCRDLIITLPDDSVHSTVVKFAR
ncbi:MAG: serine hydrolase domain-containing protein [Acidimicrobiales bacterium]